MYVAPAVNCSSSLSLASSVVLCFLVVVGVRLCVQPHRSVVVEVFPYHRKRYGFKTVAVRQRVCLCASVSVCLCACASASASAFASMCLSY